MSEAALLRWQFRLVHESLDAVFDTLLVQEHAPYARVTVCEDVIINGVLAGGKPLAFSTWRGQTGLSELPPLTSPTEWRAWARRVRIHPLSFRAYVSAVHATTDAYLAELDTDRCGETHIRVLVALLLRVSTTHAELATLQVACRDP
jgi:hypothetical protein